MKGGGHADAWTQLSQMPRTCRLVGRIPLAVCFLRAGADRAKGVPLAAVLLGDDAEGRLCVRKTPGAMGWEARPAWAPANVPAAVYS